MNEQEIPPDVRKLIEGAIWQHRMDRPSRMVVVESEFPVESGLTNLIEAIAKIKNDARVTEDKPETEQFGQQTKKPPQPRLSVDLGRKTLTFESNTHDVNSEYALRWVKVLADHPREWISGPDLKIYDELLDNRTDRLKGHLPKVILDLIDSETGKGSRIRI